MKNSLYLIFIFVLLSGCHQRERYLDENKLAGFDKINSKPSERQVAYQQVKPYRGKKKDLIVIDPGHGGEDAGTRSLTSPRYQEKSLNLSTANFLKEYLQKMGYLVKMTRNDDTFIPLTTRSLMANDYRSKLFVSVHYNAAASEQAEGIEVYYYQEGDKTRSSSSKLLAESVLSQLIEKTGAKSRGVKHGNLSVIRETEMPAILVEGGFMTNKKEMDKIKDPSYIKQISYGIAVGIDQYLKKTQTLVR